MKYYLIMNVFKDDIALLREDHHVLKARLKSDEWTVIGEAPAAITFDGKPVAPLELVKRKRALMDKWGINPQKKTIKKPKPKPKAPSTSVRRVLAKFVKSGA